MDYKKIYKSLIEKGRARGNNKKILGYYTEVHHIELRSMGGTNDPENLVLLTAREHFIAHKLLWYVDKNCIQYRRALWAFMGGRKRLTSKQFSKLREQLAKSNSGEGNPFYGRTHTEETKRKVGEASKGRKQPKESIEKSRLANLGAKRSPKAIENMRQAALNKNLAPWETSAVKVSPYNTVIWINASEFHSFWIKYGKPGARRFVSLYNEFLCDDIGYGSVTTMLKMFNKGFIPSENDRWKEFYNRTLTTTWQTN